MRWAAVLVVLAASPAAAHDPYDGLRDPVTGATCCQEIDCVAVPDSDVLALGEGDYRYLPKRWDVPSRRVIRSPDNRYHVCTFARPRHSGESGSGPQEELLRCFMAPERQVSALP